MIEFESVTTVGTRAPILVNTEKLAYFEPLADSDDRCRLVMDDGRQVVAATSYAEIRRLLIESRSGFATSYKQ